MTDQTPSDPAASQPSATPMSDTQEAVVASTTMETLHDAAFAEDGVWRSDNMDLIKAMFLGLACTAFFYEVFLVIFLDQGRLLAMFDNDNWVSPVIVGMTFWSLFILVFKFLRFRFQTSVWRRFRKPVISHLFSRKIYAKDTDRIIADINRILEAEGLKKYQDSIIYRRILRVLYLLRGASRKEGLDNLLDYQGQIDVKKMETGFTILQVFIWAIPILGFIGTVMGIGLSVNEFAQFIQAAEAGGEFNAQMRSALGGVTSGLAVAFNTTFLALVLVIPVMLLTSFLHKNEEEFLLTIEEFCLEEVLPMLQVESGGAGVTEGYDDHMTRILRLSDTWLAQFEPLVKNLSQQAEMMGHQLAGLQPLVKDFTDRLLPPGGGDNPTAPGASAQAASPERSSEAPPEGSPVSSQGPAPVSAPISPVASSGAAAGKEDEPSSGS